MGINLQKGQKIDLTKGGTGLKSIMVGLGWDEAPLQEQGGGLFGRFRSRPQNQTIDCDASAILLNANGKLIGTDADSCCIYFGNLRHWSGSIIHQGDNLTGAGDGDDEQIFVDLPKVPEEIHKIVFVVNIYDANVKGQHFGLIQNAFIRLVNTQNQQEICRFNLSENYDGMTGLVVGELYRYNGEWKFNAIGQPVRDASRLQSLLNMYN
ncbi:MAG: TerD family protein [Lachnospiraceae bacterium]|nr:TerD family protein [Lachnospiraceae bacterium]